jgi:hypothetical protein
MGHPQGMGVSSGSTSGAGGAGSTLGYPLGGAGGGYPQSPQSGSHFDIVYGTTTVKAYPLTEDDLDHLTLLDGAAAFSFSVASGALTYVLTTGQNLALSSAPAQKLEFWKGTQLVSAVFGFIFLFATIALICARMNRVSGIKNRTTF